jgi:hypothetical protein
LTDHSVGEYHRDLSAGTGPRVQPWSVPMSKFLSSLVVGSALSFVSVTASSQVVLTTSSWLGPNHTLSQTQAKWCDEVRNATREPLMPCEMAWLT